MPVTVDLQPRNPIVYPAVTVPSKKPVLYNLAGWNGRDLHPVFRKTHGRYFNNYAPMIYEGNLGAWTNGRYNDTTVRDYCGCMCSYDEPYVFIDIEEKDDKELLTNKVIQVSQIQENINPFSELYLYNWPTWVKYSAPELSYPDWHNSSLISLPKMQFCPNLYIRWSNFTPAQFITLATGVINLCRQLDPSRKIIPIVKPVWGSTTNKAGQFLEYPLMEACIKGTLDAGADGVIIWMQLEHSGTGGIGLAGLQLYTETTIGPIVARI